MSDERRDERLVPDESQDMDAQTHLHAQLSSDDTSSGMQGDALIPNDVTDRYDVAGYVLGALPEEETEDIRMASARDPLLAQAIADFGAVVGELAFVAPTESINRGRSAGIRSRLLSKAATEREGRAPRAARRTADLLRPLRRREEAEAAPAEPARKSVKESKPAKPAKGPVSVAPAASRRPASTPTPPPSPRTVVINEGPRRSWGGILAAAIVVGAVVWGAQEWRMRQMQAGLDGRVSQEQESLRTDVAALTAANAQKDSVIAALTGPSMRVVNMMNYSSPDPLARVFWDQKTAEWTMYAYNLRQPKPGKTYQVWLIATSNPAPISAGTFKPNPDGSYVFHAKYALPKDALVRVAVSEESDGGGKTPSGPIVIAGK